MDVICGILCQIILVAIFLGIVYAVNPAIARSSEKKYLTQDFNTLMNEIYEEPIIQFELPVSHDKVTGIFSKQRTPINSYARTKILFFEKFMIITAAGIATKISYDEQIEFKESRKLYFYGNILIHKNSLIYNICNIFEEDDFNLMKSIVEDYHKYK